MAEVKLNIGDPKSKKTITKTVDETAAQVFISKKIGDKVNGDSFDLHGYEFEITGGSDNAGFPMRKDVKGIARKKILIVSGTGLRHNIKGRKVRKSVAGNTIYAKTAQINLKVLKHGSTPLFEAKADAKTE
ncbi:MAG: S6e family ribosomal protein [Candidatus Woesearchaeota archaeon]|jgi:small subunit ribosomal protein S6e